MPLGSAAGKIVGGPDCWSIISGNGDFVTVGSGRVVFESVVNLLEVGDNDLQNLVSWSKYHLSQSVVAVGIHLVSRLPDQRVGGGCS